MWAYNRDREFCSGLKCFSLDLAHLFYNGCVIQIGPHVNTPALDSLIIWAELINGPCSAVQTSSAVLFHFWSVRYLIFSYATQKWHCIIKESWATLDWHQCDLQTKFSRICAKKIWTLISGSLMAGWAQTPCGIPGARCHHVGDRCIIHI